LSPLSGHERTLSLKRLRRARSTSVGIQFTLVFRTRRRSINGSLSEFRFRRGKGFIMQHRAAVLAITEALMIERTLNSVIAAAPERARLQSCLQTRAVRGRMLSTRF
jgi:hypothetical protein